MNLSEMLRQLQDERNQIDQAISALQGLDSDVSSNSIRRRGRPPLNAGPAGKSGRRRMSAAARKRISDAAKARWAARKGASTAKSTSAEKTSSAPAKARGRMSPAARKRMSAMMKARWAARKKAAAKK